MAKEADNTHLAMIILDLLSRGSGTQKLGLPLGRFKREVENQAIDACTFNGWLRLIDVNYIGDDEKVYRTFVTTETGMEQIQLIKSFFNIH